MTEQMEESENIMLWNKDTNLLLPPKRGGGRSGCRQFSWICACNSLHDSFEGYGEGLGSLLIFCEQNCRVPFANTVMN